MTLQSFAALCAAASLAVPAAAQPTESSYAQQGTWAVTAVWKAPGKFVYCGATVSNGQAELRLATDGHQWEVGTRYRGQPGVVQAYYGFGVAGELANLQAQGDGWASMSIDGNQLKAFRSSPSFSLNIGKSEQTWALAGASAAVDKAAECARQRGAARPGNAPSQPVGQARPFGQGFDGWSFTATTEQPGLVNCRAIRKVGGREDIMAMRTDGNLYFSVAAEGRRGKWPNMYVMLPGAKKREWRLPSEANGQRFWFTLPDVGTAAQIAAAGQYQFAVPDDEDTGTVPLGKRAGEAWERVRQCIKANGS